MRRANLRLTLATLMILSAAAPAFAQRTILRLWLTGPVPEAPDPSMELQMLLGEKPALTHYQWVKQIQGAAERDKVDGLALIIDHPELSLPQIEELTRAIAKVKAAGKPVHAYLEDATNADYLLACAADHITIAEHSLIDIHGLRAELTFFKGALDWLGVKAELLTCGDYKTAVEPYTRTEPSMAATEQVNWLLNSKYERYLDLIAAGRNLSRADAEAAVDVAPLWAEDALSRKLVDAVGSYDDFRQMIRKEYGPGVNVLKQLNRKAALDVDFNNPFAFFEIFQQAMEQASTEPEPGIALIYVDGMILTGVAQGGPFAEQIAASSTIRAALDYARDADHLRAAVLRINSPGGSALASDIMWQAARRFAREKPLIVSMGSVAGSGGYYVACAGDTVFAEQSTTTGSIGVLGGKIVWSGLMEDRLGITSTEFTRGENAGFMSPNQSFTDAGRHRMQQLLNRIYDQFKQRVTATRGQQLVGELDELAGGRVYTGAQALERGLVDEIGGLADALDRAAEKVGLTDPDVYILPKKEELADVLARLFGEPQRDPYEITADTAPSGALALPAKWSTALPLLDRLAPSHARALKRALLSLQLMQHETVICYDPMLDMAR